MSKEQNLIWLSFGFLWQEVVVYAGEGFEIVAKTFDGGKNWEMIYRSTGEEDVL